MILLTVSQLYFWGSTVYSISSKAHKRLEKTRLSCDHRVSIFCSEFATASRSSALEPVCANGNKSVRALRCQRWLCVKDDFWNLTVLHGRAVIVACGVAEREAGFGSGAGQLVRDLTHAFSAVVWIWSLQEERRMLHNNFLTMRFNGMNVKRTVPSV